MYVMDRKLWIATYVATWAVVLAVFLLDSPLWVRVIMSVLALGFVGFTDPAPRRAETVRAGCYCVRCESMWTRHKRRRTDVG